jgi:hypothetical protein
MDGSRSEDREFSLSKVQEQFDEARALKECLAYLHPLAATQGFALCAKHIDLAHDAIAQTEAELGKTLRKLKPPMSKDRGS